MSGSPSPYTNSTTFSISGAPTSLPLVDHLTADLPAKAFGIVGGAVVAADGTLVSGVDEGAKAKAYHDWCRERRVQPNYAGIDNVLSRKITIPIYGPGNYPTWVAPNFASTDPVLLVAPAPEDLVDIPFSEVSGWRGTVKNAIKIENISPSLKGKVIRISNGNEKLIGRGPNSSYRMGQTFIVNDDVGHITPALTQNWKTDTWLDDGTTCTAQTVRERVSVQGLSVTVYRPSASENLAAGLREKIVSITRANTSVDGVYINNLSGDVIPVGLLVGNTMFVSVNNSSVHRIGSDDKNYSISVGESSEIDLYGNNSTDARSSFDISHGVNIRVHGGSYLERVGAHWCVGTQFIGALIGGVHIAGGDLQIIGGRQVLDGSEPGGGNMVNIRQDGMEFTGQIYIGGGFISTIDVTKSEADPAVISFRGSASTQEPLRPVIMPDNIYVEDSVQIRVVGNNPDRNLLLLNGLRPFADFRQKIITNGRIYFGCDVQFADGVLFNATDKLPRTRLQIHRPDCGAGAGYDIHVKGVPGLHAEVGAQRNTALSEFPRHAVTVEGSTGPVVFRLNRGAVRKAVAIDCADTLSYRRARTCPVSLSR